MNAARRYRTAAVKPAPPLEDAEQEVYVRWFEYQFPTTRILMIPNGCYLFGDPARRAAQMAKLKRMGLKTGVPDLFVPAWSFWLELKRTSGGRVSDEQADWHAYLRSIGHTIIVAPGADSAMRMTMTFARVRETSRLPEASGQA